MHQETNQDESSFSDDPFENLRLENELLKLKLQAQFGARTECDADALSPEAELDFLRHVQRFEEAWENVSYIKIYDLLGRPAFEKLANLHSSQEVQSELVRINNLLEEKDIYLDVLGEYEPGVIYRFITEELFDYETEDLQTLDMRKVFTYEEFYPNHKMDMENSTRDFLKAWFNQNFVEFSVDFSREMINIDGKRFRPEEIIKRLNKELENYLSLSNEQYTIFDTSFNWNEPEGQGLGHTEGVVEYDALMNNGECVHVKGPFKFYYCNELGYWNIFNFIFPGFTW